MVKKINLKTSKINEEISNDLVVKAHDPRGCGFKPRHRILDGYK
jgi:hypothetical protein